MFKTLLTQMREKSEKKKKPNLPLPLVIEIHEADLMEPIEVQLEDLPPPQPPVKPITITFEDLANLAIPEISITTKDLPSIIHVRIKDLPPILNITMADLPADLNFMSTECYHGTSWDAAEQIKKHGFKVGSGAALGAGIYFSVGGVGIARSFLKSSRPCIVRARVNWGKVAYLDKPKTSKFRGSGNPAAEKALKAGYNSFIQNSKFSTESPTVGIILGKIGSFIKSPHIEVIELIDPKSVTNRK